MNRFYWITIIFIVLGLAALYTPPEARIWIVAALAGLFLLLVGLGVAIPHLRLFGPGICRGPGREKRAVLTFDDGPDPASTPALLDLLRERGARAAFFCVGSRVAEHSDLVSRAVREGHLACNHSYSHSYATNFFSVSRLVEDITRTQDALLRAGSERPLFFRPPVGLTNQRVFKALQLLGLRAVFWTARGLDRNSRRTPEKIAERIIRRLRPGAIILLHDGGVPAERLVETVRILLDRLEQAGYEVVRLDELLA